MADVPLKLSIIPLKPSEIPPEENILDAGKELLAATKLWKQGKTFHKIVKTYHHPKDVERGVPWHARVSEHGPEDASFAQFWDKLGNDKANNEKCFVPDIKRVIQIKELSPTSTIWTLHYSFSPALISPRVFTVLQVTQLTEVDSRKEGIIVSIPIDLSAHTQLSKLAEEHKAVKGRYVSVESLVELENGNVEWRMATSSTPGGLIPGSLVESSMASKIAADVPLFLKWLHNLPPAEAAPQSDAQRTGNEI